MTTIWHVVVAPHWLGGLAMLMVGTLGVVFTLQNDTGRIWQTLALWAVYLAMICGAAAPWYLAARLVQ